MALLYSVVETDIIKLVGLWRSNEMLQYLHVQADPLMINFAKCKVEATRYYYSSNNTVTNNYGLV